MKYDQKRSSALLRSQNSPKAGEPIGRMKLGSINKVELQSRQYSGGSSAGLDTAYLMVRNSLSFPVGLATHVASMVELRYLQESWRTYSGWMDRPEELIKGTARTTSVEKPE